MDPAEARRVDEVVLVDGEDREVGVAEKLAAHRGQGRLHRAFSIFLFDARGRTLLQQRSPRKYHFGGLWANACCGHPRPGEELVGAARRRLGEELGVDADLREAFTFQYAARDPHSGLIEREIDHVLLGELRDKPRPHPDEIADLRWASRDELVADLAAHGELYAPWLHEATARLIAQALFPSVRA